MTNAYRVVMWIEHRNEDSVLQTIDDLNKAAMKCEWLSDTIANEHNVKELEGDRGSVVVFGGIINKFAHNSCSFIKDELLKDKKIASVEYFCISENSYANYLCDKYGWD